MKEKIVFDTKEEMEEYSKQEHRVLTDEEWELIYNKGEKLSK